MEDKTFLYLYPIAEYIDCEIEENHRRAWVRPNDSEHQFRRH